MSNTAVQPPHDWVAGLRSSVLAWWLPQAIMMAALFLSSTPRAIVWTLALAWMGVACILNARRCRRTHCRYTGPYYLWMIIPVLGLAGASASIYAWIGLGIVILGGSKLIWWVSERRIGTYS